MATETLTGHVVAGHDYENLPSPVKLDDRFAALKQQIMKDVQPKFGQRFSREVEARAGIRSRTLSRTPAECHSRSQMVRSESQRYGDVCSKKANSDHVSGGKIPSHIASAAKRAGCVLFRGVVSEKEALSWKAGLKDYTSRHRATGGRPLNDPTFWLLYWTRPQVQARSHPEIIAAMSSIMSLWHVDDSTLPIDLSSQVHHADRFRIRRPGDREYSLKPHLATP